MRLLFGMIIGAALTVGIAFLADNWTSASETAGHRTMVNWDVVGENFRVVRENVRDAWDRLSHKMAG